MSAVADAQHGSGFERLLDETIIGHPKQSRDAFRALVSYLKEDGVLFGKWVLPTSIKPHIVSQAQSGAWVRDCESLLEALDVFCKACLTDKSMVKDLGLSGSALSLLEIEPGYGRLIPVARPDAVWDAAQLSILEVNCDSPAMMTYADILEGWLVSHFPLDAFASDWDFAQQDRTERLAATLLECYREWGGTRDDPTVAIVDWPDQKTEHEQMHTARRFSRAGLPSFVCHPHELSIRDGKLFAHDRPIDVVQRRILFPDFVERETELSTLLSAYRRGLICMVNPLRSYFAGTKAALATIREPRLQSLFTGPQRSTIERLIPPTHIVTADLLNELRNEPTRWVLKPTTGHGSKGVVIGALAVSQRWQAAISDTASSSWVAQRLKPVPVYELPNVGDAEHLEFEEFFLNWNPFIFNGRFAGAITRAARGPVVSVTARGALLPTIPVRPKAEGGNAVAAE